MIIISSFYVMRINIKSYYNRKSSSQSFKTGADGLRSQFKGLRSVNLGRSIRAGWDFFFFRIYRSGGRHIYEYGFVMIYGVGIVLKRIFTLSSHAQLTKNALIISLLDSPLDREG